MLDLIASCEALFLYFGGSVFLLSLLLWFVPKCFKLGVLTMIIADVALAIAIACPRKMTEYLIEQGLSQYLPPLEQCPVSGIGAGVGFFVICLLFHLFVFVFPALRRARRAKGVRYDKNSPQAQFKSPSEGKDIQDAGASFKALRPDHNSESGDETPILDDMDEDNEPISSALATEENEPNANRKFLKQKGRNKRSRNINHLLDDESALDALQGNPLYAGVKHEQNVNSNDVRLSPDNAQVESESEAENNLSQHNPLTGVGATPSDITLGHGSAVLAEQALSQVHIPSGNANHETISLSDFINKLNKPELQSADLDLSADTAQDNGILNLTSVPKGAALGSAPHKPDTSHGDSIDIEFMPGSKVGDVLNAIDEGNVPDNLLNTKNKLEVTDNQPFSFADMFNSAKEAQNHELPEPAADIYADVTNDIAQNQEQYNAQSFSPESLDSAKTTELSVPESNADAAPLLPSSLTVSDALEQLDASDSIAPTVEDIDEKDAHLSGDETVMTISDLERMVELEESGAEVSYKSGGSQSDFTSEDKQSELAPHSAISASSGEQSSVDNQDLDAEFAANDSATNYISNLDTEDTPALDHTTDSASYAEGTSADLEGGSPEDMASDNVAAYSTHLDSVLATLTVDSGMSVEGRKTPDTYTAAEHATIVDSSESADITEHTDNFASQPVITLDPDFDNPLATARSYREDTDREREEADIDVAPSVEITAVDSDLDWDEQSTEEASEQAYLASKFANMRAQQAAAALEQEVNTDSQKSASTSGTSAVPTDSSHPVSSTSPDEIASTAPQFAQRRAQSQGSAQPQVKRQHATSLPQTDIFHGLYEPQFIQDAYSAAQVDHPQRQDRALANAMHSGVSAQSGTTVGDSQASLRTAPSIMDSEHKVVAKSGSLSLPDFSFGFTSTPVTNLPYQVTTSPVAYNTRYTANLHEQSLADLLGQTSTAVSQTLNTNLNSQYLDSDIEHQSAPQDSTKSDLDSKVDPASFFAHEQMVEAVQPTTLIQPSELPAEPEPANTELTLPAKSPVAENAPVIAETSETAVATVAATDTASAPEHIPESPTHTTSSALSPRTHEAQRTQDVMSAAPVDVETSAVAPKIAREPVSSDAAVVAQNGVTPASSKQDLAPVAQEEAHVADDSQDSTADNTDASDTALSPAISPVVLPETTVSERAPVVEQVTSELTPALAEQSALEAKSAVSGTATTQVAAPSTSKSPAEVATPSVEDLALTVASAPVPTVDTVAPVAVSQESLAQATAKTEAPASPADKITASPLAEVATPPRSTSAPAPASAPTLAPAPASASAVSQEPSVSKATPVKSQTQPQQTAPEQTQDKASSPAPSAKTPDESRTHLAPKRAGGKRPVRPQATKTVATPSVAPSPVASPASKTNQVTPAISTSPATPAREVQRTQKAPQAQTPVPAVPASTPVSAHAKTQDTPAVRAPAASAQRPATKTLARQPNDSHKASSKPQGTSPSADKATVPPTPALSQGTAVKPVSAAPAKTLGKSPKLALAKSPALDSSKSGGQSSEASRNVQPKATAPATAAQAKTPASTSARPSLKSGGMGQSKPSITAQAPASVAARNLNALLGAKSPASAPKAVPQASHSAISPSPVSNAAAASVNTNKVEPNATARKPAQPSAPQTKASTPAVAPVQAPAIQAAQATTVAPAKATHSPVSKTAPQGPAAKPTPAPQETLSQARPQAQRPTTPAPSPAQPAVKPQPQVANKPSASPAKLQSTTKVEGQQGAKAAAPQPVRRASVSSPSQAASTPSKPLASGSPMQANPHADKTAAQASKPQATTAVTAASPRPAAKSAPASVASAKPTVKAPVKTQETPATKPSPASQTAPVAQSGTFSTHSTNSAHSSTAQPTAVTASTKADSQPKTLAKGLRAKPNLANKSDSPRPQALTNGNGVNNPTLAKTPDNSLAARSRTQLAAKKGLGRNLASPAKTNQAPKEQHAEAASQELPSRSTVSVH